MGSSAACTGHILRAWPPHEHLIRKIGSLCQMASQETCGERDITDPLADLVDGLTMTWQPLSHDRPDHTERSGERQHASSTTT